MTSASPPPSAAPGSAWRSLAQLAPYLRPAAPAIAASGAAALVATLAGLAVPLVIERLIGAVGGPGATARVVGWSAVILVLGLAEAGLILLRRRIIAGPSAQLEQSMRADLYAHLQRLGMAFHDTYQSGQLLSRAFSDLSTIRRFTAFGGVFLVVNVVTIAVGAAVLLVLSWPLGLVLVAAVLPMVGLSFLYESRFKVVARLAQDQVGDLATVVEESVLGVRVLKAFGRGPTIAQRFRADAERLRRTEVRKVDVIAVLWATIIVLPELALGGMLVLGGYEVARGTTGIGTLVAAVTLMTYLRWPIESVGWLLAEANNAASATDRFWEVMRTAPTITDPVDGALAGLPLQRAAGTASRGAELRFEGVRFGYPGADGRPGQDVLAGVDLVVRAGETMALVGASGSGKTTLTGLVPRLYDVTGGRVLLDGVDLRQLPLDELRSRVSAAFEEPVLFSASVRENVALGIAEPQDGVVEQALAVASATDFTQRLPWGLDTRIGEQGLTLSGGQRQRLALARAVAGSPSVLVLDDPLSALDVHTEAEVEGALRTVLQGVTALVVAHRPSTVALADRVALLQDGRVAAVGRHADLMATVPAYRAVLSSLDEDSDEDADVDGGVRR